MSRSVRATGSDAAEAVARLRGRSSRGPALGSPAAGADVIDRCYNALPMRTEHSRKLVPTALRPDRGGDR